METRSGWGEWAYEACLDTGEIRVRPVVDVDGSRGYITVMCRNEKHGTYPSTVSPHWHPDRCFYPTLEAAEAAIVVRAKARLKAARREVRESEKIADRINAGNREAYVKEWLVEEEAG